MTKTAPAMMFRVLAAAAASVCICGVVGTSALAETLTERGSYLVNTIMACGNCHTPRDPAGHLIADKQLSGGIYFTTPAFLATAANITPDPETGIGQWTDDEIKRALMQGVRPNHGRLPGVPLAAVMPANFYKALVPSDLDAIIAYLRSVKPVRNEVPKPKYTAPVSREPYPDAEQGFDAAKLSDPVSNGRYLVTIGHCMECHSAWSRGVSDFKTGLGGGGRPFGPNLVHGLDPAWQGSVAPNITSDPVAGLGKLTDEQIIRAIRQGIAHDGHKMKPPMAVSFYAGLTDGDVHDIVAYLRTVPPLK
jgi:mono/diheme cytochrome c family protein